MPTIAQVIPSEWGTAKKPWFFLSGNYWCPGRSNNVTSDNQKALGHFESEGRDSVEPVEDELRTQVASGECVAIRGKFSLQWGEGRLLQSLQEVRRMPFLLSRCPSDPKSHVCSSCNDALRASLLASDACRERCRVCASDKLET